MCCDTFAIEIALVKACRITVSRMALQFSNFRHIHWTFVGLGSLVESTVSVGSAELRK